MGLDIPQLFADIPGSEVEGEAGDSHLCPGGLLVLTLCKGVVFPLWLTTALGSRLTVPI